MGLLVGSIDEGTSSARFSIFKVGTSEIVASHQMEIKRIHPNDGWTEQDPFELLNSVKKCIKIATEKLVDSGGNVKDIVAIGVTNQRESTIVWDKYTGMPLYNSIVWLDVRTAPLLDSLLEKTPDSNMDKNYLRHICGLPMSPYFSAIKLKWLKDNIPAVQEAIENDRCFFGTVDSWLIWNLTGGVNGGVHITDVSNASRTMLMNIATFKWDKELLTYFDLPDSILPEIRSSSEIYGYFSEGPLEGIPLAGCLGDQQSALVGQQCLKSGQAKATYGTGCFLLYNTGTTMVDSRHGLLTTVAYQMGPNEPPVYALEGSVAVAGAALSWLRDNLTVLSDFDQAQKLAEEAESENGGEVYFVPAFSGLYAPYWQPDARGIICGITLDTKKGHIIRAALEAVCFQTRDILQAMNRDYGKETLSVLQVDGGMTANTLLMQLQADLAGVTVVRPNMAECTSLGAAMVAAAAVGHWDLKGPPIDIPSRVWTPKITDEQRVFKSSKWKMAVERSLGWTL
ncbi:glycerol kinase [Agrilus planipennis]|uniref:Probable glycerol kinase n=1 Tax=Agrilus planipennis TaxID=224129 RepID=A0A7F5RL85_AGRPL|nr:glycerol kinase [Agrilus planipennis]